jgi:hypothetical protein
MYLRFHLSNWHNVAGLPCDRVQSKKCIKSLIYMIILIIYNLSQGITCQENFAIEVHHANSHMCIYRVQCVRGTLRAQGTNNKEAYHV